MIRKYGSGNRNSSFHFRNIFWNCSILETRNCSVIRSGKRKYFGLRSENRKNSGTRSGNRKIPKHVPKTGKILEHVPETRKIPEHVPETIKFRNKHIPETGKHSGTRSGNRKISVMHLETEQKIYELFSTSSMIECGYWLLLCGRN